MISDLFSGPVAYKDIKTRWIAIPLIVLLSHYLTYNGFDSVGWLVYELFSDGIKVWLVWMVILADIYYLDRNLPWPGNFLKRLIFQLILTIVTGMATLTLAQLIDYGLIRWYPIDHYDFDLVIALLFILLVNAIYIILYYQHSLQASHEDLAAIKKRQTESLRTNSLLIKLGKRQIAVPFDKICCFYAVNKNTLLFTADGQIYPVDLSLDQIEKEPCSVNMFRANRQYLITHGIIKSINTEANGKVNVFMKLPQLKEPFITVSREKASAFRQWFIK